MRGAQIEQRKLPFVRLDGSAYRMGQEQPVQVFILVTERTIEERRLAILSAKHDLFLAALDVESEVDQWDLEGAMESGRLRHGICAFLIKVSGTTNPRVGQSNENGPVPQRNA